MTPTKSRITAISIPQETQKLLKQLQIKSGKSRSLLLREMINYYVSSARRESRIAKADSPVTFINDSDANLILKLYHRLLSENRPKPVVVVGIAIINKKNQVLIGLRKSTDQLIRDLHWTFPSGKFSSLNFESELVRTISRETGIDTNPGNLIHARLIPDSPKKKVRIIGLYYHCRVASGRQKPGGDFKELKWVDAVTVNRFFTTSVADEVMNFLGNL